MEDEMKDVLREYREAEQAAREVPGEDYADRVGRVHDARNSYLDELRNEGRRVPHQL